MKKLFRITELREPCLDNDFLTTDSSKNDSLSYRLNLYT